MKSVRSDRELTALARDVFDELRARNVRLVLAESCTGGLAAALLARIPGVSQFLCGSAVVYQVETKARWLKVDRAILKDPGPISAEVASAMAQGVLEATPQADLAASITGHLGPSAPPTQDGLVFMGFCRRAKPKTKTARVKIQKLQLSTEAGDQTVAGERRRLRRQRSAAAHLLEWILSNLRDSRNSSTDR